jgi:hypothetical protein
MDGATAALNEKLNRLLTEAAHVSQALDRAVGTITGVSIIPRSKLGLTMALRWQVDKNQRPLVVSCPDEVAHLLRFWSRKAWELRFPADADASRDAGPRVFRRGIR